ncbi:MAG TPA: prolyl oligopeptidase family serine peptidase [Blastocatellia bacterium]|nr:prolyl oligopeptidase family serine peptidase [Blastocatellia bacterium]
MKLTHSLTFPLIIATTSLYSFGQNHPTEPKTRVEPVSEEIHGVNITDNYRWLEDQNSPETRAWINEENQYTKSLLDSVAGRNQIHQRLEKLIKVDTISSPFELGGRYFFYRRRADQNQPVLYVRYGLNGKDEVLIDPNSMSPDNSVSVTLTGVSKDGKLLAYGIRHGGKDEVEINIMDVDAKKDLPDKLPVERYSGVSFENSHAGFFYGTFGSKPPALFYHKMGTDLSADRKIFGDGFGLTDIIGSSMSDDGRYLVIFVPHGSSGDDTKVYLRDAQNDGKITPIVDDIKASFGGPEAGGHLYLQTNWNAPNNKIVDVNLQDTGRDHWRVVVPESDRPIDSFSVAGGKLFVRYLKDVVPQVKVFDTSGKLEREISLPSIGSIGNIQGRWDSKEAFYTFTSFTTPTTIYRYDIDTGKSEVWAKIEIPVDSAQMEVKQVWYPSKDGTKVPMFLVYKKGLKLDGNNPTFLTGYGGFNVSLLPGFSSVAALWVESGGIFAQPNLRGGGEFGEKWHQAGMLANKQNVFDDFIASAEWLIKNKYTSPAKLAISGGSNGGLLVGAAVTQRPDLYRAVLCSFPLLDMIRYQDFLVAKFWVPEYGSSEDPDQFKYILKYSPYQNVKKGTKYPAMMFISGDFDTRVAPLHARKMCALMQASTGSDKPILLHYDTEAGHSGGQPVSKTIDNLTDELTFLFWQLGIPAS